MPHDTLVLHGDRIISIVFDSMLFVWNHITFPRLIPIVSMCGVWYIWQKNKIGFLFHAAAATCWVIYDFNIGAYEQGVNVSATIIFCTIGFIKWWRNE